MNHLTPETAVPLATVFLQGLLSFFSPCVLPLLPMYFSYLSGGTARFDENGRMSFDRGRVMLNTVFFALGVSAAFFILGLGLSAAGIFFRTNRLLFARIGGVIMILFGLYQLGVFGNTQNITPIHAKVLILATRPSVPTADFFISINRWRVRVR